MKTFIEEFFPPYEGMDAEFTVVDALVAQAEMLMEMDHEYDENTDYDGGDYFELALERAYEHEGTISGADLLRAQAEIVALWDNTFGGEITNPYFK